MIQHSDGSWENPMIFEVDERLTLPKLIYKRAQKHPNMVIAERRTGVGHWTKATSAEFAARARTLAAGMYGMGVRRGDKVAILAATSYDWACLDTAILTLGAVTVPIYESDSAAQISHILKDAGVRMVITQRTQQADLVKSVAPKGVRDVLSLDRGAIGTLSHRGHNVSEETIDQCIEDTTIEDVATLIYTSGTTGLPKGVILTHGNFVRPILQTYDILPELIDDSGSRTLLFLPVAHVLARFVMHCILAGKGRIGFCPDTRTLLQDIESFKPTMMLTVPRVLEKVYNSAAAKTGKGIKSTLFSWSANQSRKFSEVTAYPVSTHPAQQDAKANDEAAKESRRTKPAENSKDKNERSSAHSHRRKTKHVSPGPTLGLKVSHQIAEALVLNKIKKVLGPNLHTVICGGAPLSVDLANFYRGMGITLLLGYGLSETTGPITVERPDDNPPDSVGYLWPGNSMKIGEDGEVLLKGVSVTSGYHNLKDETKRSFSDGWFNTGDLGSIDEDGRLRITGRKKELIVTAGGKNVSPEVLEHDLGTHPLIGQILVIGDNRPYIGALITLDAEMLPQWLQNHGLRVVSAHEAAAIPEIKHSIEKAIARANRKVSRAESIRRYRIINAEFTVENGYLTPSLKLKRHKVLADFANEVELLYAQSPEELAGVGGSIEVLVESEAREKKGR